MTVPRDVRRRSAPRRVAFVCVVLAGLAGCGQETPSSPSTGLAVAGTWTGVVTDRSAGVGQLTLSISGTGDTGTGTFQLTVADANLGGLVLANAQQAPTITLTLNVTSIARDCTGAPGVFYTARLALTGPRMTGTYDPSIGCPLLTGGAIELTRR
jgi:hypothetical protein